MKKKLRIAQIAPLWFLIPPQKYGGIERVVDALTSGLVERGHEVTLFAAPGSKTRAKLISVYPKPLIAAGIAWSNPVWNLRNLSRAYEMAGAGKFDIVHSHLDVWTLFFSGILKTPTVLTMHNPLYRTNADAAKDDRLRLFKEEQKTINTVFISQSAKKQAMVRLKNSAVIYNGVGLRDFKFNPNGGDHFIWIARVNKHKGIENAIAAAERTGSKLLLAGRLDATQKTYFNSAIKPRLNKKIKYIGELSQNELSKFYGSAKALLYPIEWEEPFGLVVAEAMACGTPVIAYRRGSMPELIRDGKSGFVVDNLSEMIAAMKKIESLNRADVHRHVGSYFTNERMVDAYEKLYYRLLK